MKKCCSPVFATILFFISISSSLNAQCTSGGCGSQLIPNNGFETPSSTCSITDIQLYNSVSPVQSWFGTDNYPGAGSSPDFYYPGCGGTATFSCQVGSGFTGIFAKLSSFVGREYIQAQLTAPLIAGHRYCFSMIVRAKTAAAGPTIYGSDGIGAWFHNMGLINIQTMNGGNQFLGTGSTINATPQIQNASGNIITNSCYTVTGEFCATGGEQWVVIGNFKTDAATITSPTSGGMSYLYIDEVSLKESCSVFDNTLTASQDTVCMGACTTINSAAVGGSGTYTYLWAPGGQSTSSISVCPATTSTYTLYTSSLSTCGVTITDTASITIYANACVPNVSLNDTSLCAGSCSTLTPQVLAATAPYTYLWSEGAQTSATINYCGLATSSIWVQVTDANGYVFSDTAIITINPIPVANAGWDDTLCLGNPYTLSGSGGGTYLWLGGAASANYTVSPVATSTYVLTVTSSGCSDSDTVKLTVQAAPVVSITTVDVSCFGLSDGSASATVTGTAAVYNYHWSPVLSSASSLSGIPAGIYNLNVTDEAGCNVSQPVTVNQPPVLNVSISGSDTICAADHTQLTGSATGGSPGYTYGWLPAGIASATITINPVASTTYTLIVTDNQGCKDSAAFLLTVKNKPMAIFAGPGSACAPLNASFINNSLGAVSYQWDLDDGFTSTSVSPVQLYDEPGCKNIQLIVTSANGCSDTLSEACAFEVYALPEAGLISAEAVVSEVTPDVHFVNSSNGSTNCVTCFGDGTSTNDCDTYLTHHYDSVGIYTITQVVYNSNGCADSTTIQVEVKAESTIWIPNAFTPNGNGLNETFMAQGYGVEEFRMMIFNRWGQKIFESTDITVGWDGTYGGHEAEQDVYVYSVFYKDSRKGNQQLRGNVNLVR